MIAGRNIVNVPKDVAMAITAFESPESRFRNSITPFGSEASSIVQEARVIANNATINVTICSEIKDFTV